jgi:hypothetical protein
MSMRRRKRSTADEVGPWRAFDARVTGTASAPERPPRRSVAFLARRAAIVVAVALLSLYGVYVTGINIFLSTSLFEKTINQEPDTVLVLYERAWSVWPGRIHARRLRIRSRDTKVEWILRVENVRFDVSFLALAAKKLHASHVRGSAITFEARQRIEAPAATPEYVDALPPLPGFERIPLRPLAPPDLEERWNDAKWHLWTVELDDVVAEDVREVWIDAVRFAGRARIAGGFYLKPIRLAHIDGVHVDVHDGRLTVKNRLVLETLAGAVDLTVKPFDPRTVLGVDLLHRVQLATDLRGRSPDLAALPERLAAPMRIAGPADVRRFAVKVVDGIVREDSHVDVAVPGATVEMDGHRVDGDLALAGDVALDSGRPRLTFRIEGRALTAARASGDEPVRLLEAPALGVTGDATALDLGAPLLDLHAVAVLPEATVPDARALDFYVAPAGSVGFQGGRARARVRFEAWRAEERAKAEATLEAKDLQLRVAKARVAGETKLAASFEAWRWSANRLEGVDVKVHVASGSIARESAPDAPLVHVRGLDVGAQLAEVDLDDPLRAFKVNVDLPDGEIVDRELLHAFLPPGTNMKLATAHARFDAQCALEVESRLGKGRVDIHAPQLGFVVDELGIVADLRAHALVHDWAWEHGDLAVDQARLDLTRIVAKKKGARAPALVASRLAVEAKSARFAFSDPLADVRLDAVVEGGTLIDPVAFNAFLPRGSDLQVDADPAGAPFSGEMHGVVEKHVARGKVSVRGHGVGVRGAKVRLRGDVDAVADVEHWRLEEGRMRVKSSRVVLGRVAVDFGSSPSSGSADGTARHAERSPQREGPPDLEAKRIELHAMNDELDIAHPSLRGVDYRLSVDDARMEDAKSLGALFASNESAPFAVESGRMHARVDVTVTSSARTATGGVELAFAGAGVRLRETQLRGDLAITAHVNGFDAQRDGYVDISGSRVVLSDMKAAGASAESAAWSGEVELLQGAVQVSEAPAFDGFVQLRADDANPILALAFGSSLPKFVVGMMKADGLSGQANITIEPGRAAIRQAHVRGDDIVAYGDYVAVGDHVPGAAVVAKGPLSAGVKVDDEGTYLRLFALEPWRQEERRAALALFAAGGAQAKARARVEARAKAEADARARADAKARTSHP